MTSITSIDSQPCNDTTKSASMLVEIEKHLKIVNALESIQRTINSYSISYK